MMIRDAGPDDVPAITALWNALIRDTLVTFTAVEKEHDDVARLLEERRAAGHAFLVPVKDGAVVGFGGYAPFRGGDGYARTMEHSILLAEAARGQGAGRNLLHALEDHARAAGHRSMIACVSGTNADGRAFHAAMGYAEVAVVPEAGYKWDRWLDLVLMQKMLSGPGARR